MNTYTSIVEDIDCTDDIALLSHKHYDMQATIEHMTRKSRSGNVLSTPLYGAESWKMADTIRFLEH